MDLITSTINPLPTQQTRGVCLPWPGALSHGTWSSRTGTKAYCTASESPQAWVWVEQCLFSTCVLGTPCPAQTGPLNMCETRRRLELGSGLSHGL